jgi:hypothetical protein
MLDSDPQVSFCEIEFDTTNVLQAMRSDGSVFESPRQQPATWSASRASVGVTVFLL